MSDDELAAIIAGKAPAAPAERLPLDPKKVN
jgi:hypothetical protein